MAIKLGLLFPGQGSQSIGMLAQLEQQMPLVTKTWREASGVLGYDLYERVYHGSAEMLDRTEVAQPALLAADIAVWRAWYAEHGQRPHLLAGHSLGEYAALVCAEVLTFDDALRLVAQRAHYMQEAVPEGKGAMAAVVGLSDDQVQALCERTVAAGEVLSPANYNTRGQVVIAGHATAVDRALSEAKAAGARLTKRLPVSVPSHCDLMRPAAEKFAAVLENTRFNPPKLPVLHNVNVDTLGHPDDIRGALTRQLYSPVRWVETMQAMLNDELHLVLECGPGKVLSGLMKRMKSAVSCWSLGDPEGLLKAVE